MTIKFDQIMKPSKIVLITLILTTLAITDFSCKKDLLKQVSITPGTFTDPRDGRTYKTTTIGSYTWLAENLDFATDSSFYYNNDTLNKVYGRLYTWNAAQAAFPAGWHLPTMGELDFLYNNLGSYASGFQLKETGNAHWDGNNSNSNNYSQLTIIPGGEYSASLNQYQYLRTCAVFWENNKYTWIVTQYGDIYYRYENYFDTPYGRYAIRCVKDY